MTETSLISYLIIPLLGLVTGILLYRFFPRTLITRLKTIIDDMGYAAPYVAFGTMLLFVSGLMVFLDDPVPVGGPKGNTVYEELDALYAKYGEYVQVTQDGRILVGSNEVNEATLASKLPSNTVINVYDGPYGKGYEIITTPPPVVTASSTP